ncbi:MAG: formylglycine-generating enzyme family protein [Bacteroidota bacterium]
MVQKINFQPLAVIILFLAASLLCLTDKGPSPPAPKDMVFVPGGTSPIGSTAHFEQETPVTMHEVKGIFMDVHPVTVGQFRKFINATSYQTDAEKFGNAGVFDMEKKEWQLVERATWEFPLGPDQMKAKDDHPVTQVSWRDAIAYAKWAGKRLPTEAEFEHAARAAGRIQQNIYPWGGDRIKDDGAYRANIWQGAFPWINRVEDGYQYTSPVGAFGETELGLRDMVGNVWEWSADWKLPYGSDLECFQPNENSEKAMRGGSFLCEPGWCHGYRVSSRSGSTPETSLFHVGFRCVKDLPTTK